MRSCFILCLFVALRVAGAESAPADLALLKQSFANLQTACENLDADAAFKVMPFAPGASMVNSDGSLSAPAEYQQGLREFYHSQRKLRFTTLALQERSPAPGMVLRVWSYQVDGESKKGKVWRIDCETATYLMGWTGQEWQCLAYHESSGPAHAVTPAPTSP